MGYDCKYDGTRSQTKTNHENIFTRLLNARVAWQRVQKDGAVRPHAHEWPGPVPHAHSDGGAHCTDCRPVLAPAPRCGTLTMRFLLRRMAARRRVDPKRKLVRWLQSWPTSARPLGPRTALTQYSGTAGPLAVQHFLHAVQAASRHRTKCALY